MELVRTEGVSHQQASDSNEYRFPNHLFSRVMMAVLLVDGDRRSLLDQLVGGYIKYDDVRYYILQNTGYVILVTHDFYYCIL